MPPFIVIKRRNVHARIYGKRINIKHRFETLLEEGGGGGGDGDDEVEDGESFFIDFEPPSRPCN